MSPRTRSPLNIPGACASAEPDAPSASLAEGCEMRPGAAGRVDCVASAYWCLPLGMTVSVF